MYDIPSEMKRRAKTPKQMAKEIERDGKETIQMAKEQEIRGKTMMMGSKALLEDLRSHAKGMMS